MSINGQGHSLTLVKGHSDFKVKCLTFGLYTQVSDSGPLGPLVRHSNTKGDYGTQEKKSLFLFEQKILLSSTVFHIFRITFFHCVSHIQDRTREKIPVFQVIII